MDKLKELADFLGVDIKDLKPTEKELLALITPLIPKPIKGDTGEDGKDGETPTKSELVKLIKPLIPEPKNGKDGKDGISPDIDTIIYEATKKTEEKLKPFIPKVEDIEKDLPKLGDPIRDSLELLKDEDRLDISAIRGVDKLEKKLTKKIDSTPRGGGARGVQLYVDSAKKGMANFLNLVAGSGVTLTYTPSSGRNDVTISATAGGALETPTGTIDGLNTIFTFLASPKVIIVDQGRTLILNNGFTADITGLVITVDIAPNFSIFSI